MLIEDRLETVVDSIAEQLQVFKGAGHAFMWKPKLRIPDSRGGVSVRSWCGSLPSSGTRGRRFSRALEVRSESCPRGVCESGGSSPRGGPNAYRRVVARLGYRARVSDLDCVERRSAVLQSGTAGGRVPQPIVRRPFRSRRCGNGDCQTDRRSRVAGWTEFSCRFHCLNDVRQAMLSTNTKREMRSILMQSAASLLPSIHNE